MMPGVFQQYIPADAIAYCEQLHRQFGFTLKIVKPRRTRLGDFRVLPTGHTQITVNADLTPEGFLITYVHEVAHAAVHARQRRLVRPRKLAPHGPVWQSTFRELMQPILNESVFSAAVLLPLINYLKQPAATTAGCSALMNALRLTASAPDNRPTVGDLPEGAVFRLAKKTFIRGTLRRTRFVCKEVSTGRLYLISKQAYVDI
jgi:hypothetical protein